MSESKRFSFIDEFRGLVGVMMVLGHSNYYFNYLWKQFDPLDPLFASLGQFWLRYMGYLCAPGFLMMNGAMVWYSYTKRREAGKSDMGTRWRLIQRGLFLVLVQLVWVNSSWGGFKALRLDHLGIISCIGISMIFLSAVVHTRWYVRLGLALLLFTIHPFLLAIEYDKSGGLGQVVMQFFVDSGKFNKYPIIPWFGLALMGSVMATGWLSGWKTARQRISMSALIALAAFLAATIVRMGRGFGNIFPFSDFGHYSFFLDQKYPPSLYHVLWFFGAVTAGVMLIQVIALISPKITAPLGIVGRVPLFYYCIHIAILGIFSKRLDIYYREGAVAESLFGWVIMMIIMLPLAAWFGRVKRRSRNYFIRLI